MVVTDRRSGNCASSAPAGTGPANSNCQVRGRSKDICSSHGSLERAHCPQVRRLPAKLGKPSLFWHHDGEPYKTASGQFKRLVKSVDRQAQKQARETPEQAHSFRSFRLHDLRHRHAVDWLKSGRSIYDLQLRLGHTSVKTTEIYLAYLTGDEQRIVKYGPSTEGTKSGTNQTVVPNRK
jgi:hypothetical protein